MKFRQDINGLRAIAVIAVVLFHFNSKWLPGGFVGVDIFFVISGFLMTKIIFTGLETRTFSIFRFYMARARRIIPALTVLCLAVLVFGWFYLNSMDYETLGKHAASSLGFLSNLIYFKESGYFSATSHEKWLLHTWSLSVEWQFYIIYPLILVLMHKYVTVRIIKKIILAMTVLGFIATVIATYKWPVAAFYLLPTRAWEMMLGGLAYLFPLTLAKKHKPWLELSGFTLLCITFIFISEDELWPGYLSLLPALGTFLIIQSQRNDSRLSNNIVFQKIGLWSYSIYLWHWPLVVLLYDFGYSFQGALLGLVLSCLLGFISYKMVESKLSKKLPHISFIGIVAYKPILSSGVVAMLATIIFLTDGINQAFRSAANTDATIYLSKYQRETYMDDFFHQEYRQECSYYDHVTQQVRPNGIAPACTYKTGPGGLFLWGDSHAKALSFGIRNALNQQTPFYQLASSGCRPLIENDSQTLGVKRKACDLSNEKAQRSIVKLNPAVIMLAQRDDHDKTDYLKIVQSLRAKGVSSKFVLVGPVPQWQPSLPKAIAKRHMDNTKLRIKDIYFVTHLSKVDRALKEKYTGSEIHYISLIDYLCNKNGCIAKVDNNNTPLVWDYGHLSFKGSSYVVDNIIYNKIKNYL